MQNSDPTVARRDKINGFWATFSAFGLWGFLPVYWKSISFLDPFLILLHRIFWSFLMLLCLLAAGGSLRETLSSLGDKRYCRMVIARSLILSLNWLLYIWAVNSGRIVEASLGYFLAPLMNMLSGLIFFRERPGLAQRCAMGLAFAGVALQVVLFGDIPWAALAISITFCAYGSLRKVDKKSALEGLFLETALVVPLVAAGLIWYAAQGNLGLGFGFGLWPSLLVICSGPVTSIPLILFAYGAKRINLTTVGVIQYIYPTFILLTGTLIYGEVVSQGGWISFSFIWVALALYTAAGFRAHRKAAA